MSIFYLFLCISLQFFFFFIKKILRKITVKFSVGFFSGGTIGQSACLEKVVLKPVFLLIFRKKDKGFFLGNFSDVWVLNLFDFVRFVLKVILKVVFVFIDGISGVDLNF